MSLGSFKLKLTGQQFMQTRWRQNNELNNPYAKIYKVLKTVFEIIPAFRLYSKNGDVFYKQNVLSRFYIWTK